MVTRPAVLMLALATTGCGGSNGPSTPTAPAPIPATQACEVLGNLQSTVGGTLAILSGTECSVEVSPIVKLNLRQASGSLSAGTCSGTVIAPRAVLTAAHCLDGQEIDEVRVWFGAGPEFVASSYAYYPGFRFNESGFDVGVVLMDQDLPRAPARILTSRSGQIGEAAVIAGFGRDENSDTRRLRAGSTNLSGVTDTYLHTVYAPPSSSICQGDSGGPIFLQQGGGWALAGISSATSGSVCNDTGTNYYLSVRNTAVLNFIRQHVPAVVER